MEQRLEKLRGCVRAVPDFPKPGILFRDITPLLASPEHFRATIDLFHERYRAEKIDQIVAIEARGFLIGAALAYLMECPLGIVRKPGKLPWKTDTISYSLEYGESTLQLHQDQLKPDDRVLIVDDLLATGGTARAACSLVEKQGARVAEVAFIIELRDLGGREALGVPCFSLLSY